MNKKTYNIPVVWQMMGYVTVEAESFDAAVDTARESELPEGSYIENSFEVDYEGITEA